MIGSINLTESSPVQTFVEPLSLAEVKKNLNLPERSPVEADEDTEIEAFIIAAREIAETLQGRDLVEKQQDISFDYWPCNAIKLRDPLTSVDLVQYTDSDGGVTTLVENTDYIVDTRKHPGIILPVYGGSWPSFTPWPSSAVLVRFTSGIANDSVFWVDGPGKRIKQGMMMLVSGWFNNRFPFQETQSQQILEYPYAITSLLTYGALPRAR